MTTRITRTTYEHVTCKSRAVPSHFATFGRGTRTRVAAATCEKGPAARNSNNNNNNNKNNNNDNNNDDNNNNNNNNDNNKIAPL